MANIKILCVGDEPFLGKIVRESLESRAFDLRWVEDGDLVLEALEQFQPDVCVLSLPLPSQPLPTSPSAAIASPPPGRNCCSTGNRASSRIAATGYSGRPAERIHSPERYSGPGPGQRFVL